MENPGWFRNSAGFWFNARFGFGLMNAFALVSASSNWTTVPEKTTCTVNVEQIVDERLTYGNTKKLRFRVGDQCRLVGNEITFMEHVEIEVTLEYSIRGALQMHLTAPSGTKVQILKPRRLDDSAAGFEKWKFMSVASWGEDPRGTWILDIIDEIGPKGNNGTIGALTMILHGTKEIPEYRKNGPRVYNLDYNRIRKTNDDPPVKSMFSDRMNPLIKETNDIYEYDWLNKLLQI